MWMRKPGNMPRYFPEQPEAVFINAPARQKLDFIETEGKNVQKILA